MSTPTSSPDPSHVSAGAGSYLQLLALPGAAPFFAAASAGRVGVAATALGLIWLITGSGGSFAAAGTVVGAFALTEAVIGPQVARLIDRFGQTRVLPPVLAVHAIAMGLVVAAASTGASAPVLAVAGAVAGASIPQLGALSSARWVALLEGRRAWLARAFALESLANAIAFLAGPVLVSAVAATGRAWAGTAGAAALVLGGGSALAALRASAPPVGDPAAGRDREPAARPPRASGLRSARFAALVALSAVLGVHFGAVTLSITAWAQQQGSPAVATTLFALSGGAGLVGAWAYGLRRWRAGATTQLCWSVAAVAVGAAAMALIAATSQSGAVAPARSVGLGVCLAVIGLAVPVVIVQLSVLTEAGLERAVLTQALTWSNSASAAGSAGAGALAGALIDRAGAAAGFLLLAAVGAALLLLAVGARRRLQPSTG